MVSLFSTMLILLFSFNTGIIHNACMALTGNDETIKGSGKGTITNIGETRKLFVGSGTNSIMGEVYIEIDYHLAYETQYSGGFVPGGTGFSRSSNGEEFYVAITGGSWYVNFVPDPPETIFEMKGKFTGGTGRFINATGQFVATGTNIYVPSTPTVFDFTGTINY